MYEAEDKLFFDELYQQWSKTTGAEEMYYEVADRGDTCDDAVRFQVYATNATDGHQRYVAGFFSEQDADFFAGLHGAIPDLIRRLHEAIDEAVSKDEARDKAEANYAEALLENMALLEELRSLERELDR